VYGVSIGTNNKGRKKVGIKGIDEMEKDGIIFPKNDIADECGLSSRVIPESKKLHLDDLYLHLPKFDSIEVF